MSNILSFEEKSAWVQLLTLVGVLGSYFVAAASMLREGIYALQAYAALFIGAVVVLIMVMVAGHVFAALMGTPEDADERDRLIAWKAESRSSWIMGIGSFSAITALLLNMESVWVAHILLLSLCLSEVLKNILQIIAYRRGA